jgi:MFS transporter, SP family, arabinose:H+ symporter
MIKESRFYLYTVSLTAALGGLLFGFDTGVISGAITFVSSHFQLSPHMEGFTVSSLVIACIVGASLAGPLSDKWGRKPILIIAAFCFIISATLAAIPKTIWELILARFIGGLAVGAASVISPMYITEVSPKKIRGALVSLNQLTIVLGILITYLSNWLLEDTGSNNWRYMFAAQNVPAVLFFAALFFIPESPRYLLKKNKFKKARDILVKINGPEKADLEISEINNSPIQQKVNIPELWLKGKRIIIAALLLAFLSQVTGIDSIVYYAPKVLMKVGFQETSSVFLASLLVPITLMIFTVVAMYTIDKYGRRPLLLIGTMGMGISFLIVGLSFLIPTLTNFGVLIGIVLFIVFFAISLGPIPWLYISEVFPTRVRGSAVAIATNVLWISNFLVAQFFPWMIDNLKGKSYFVFSAICFITFVFVWFMIDETKGKSLEEIEEVWN